MNPISMRNKTVQVVTGLRGQEEETGKTGKNKVHKEKGT